MDFHLERITLHSQSAEIYAHFVSGVFDLSIKSLDQQSFEFTIGNTRFLLKEQEQGPGETGPGIIPMFEFYTSKIEAIGEFADRIRFYYYTSGHLFDQKHTEFFENESSQNSVSIYDPDLRIWRLKYLKAE
jgi:hypothetical protein